MSNNSKFFKSQLEYLKAATGTVNMDYITVFLPEDDYEIIMQFYKDITTHLDSWSSFNSKEYYIKTKSFWYKVDSSKIIRYDTSTMKKLTIRLSSNDKNVQALPWYLTANAGKKINLY